MSKQKAIIVSGYFNPIHKGHLEYFNNAKAMTIKELAELIQSTVGHQGEIIWDSTKPDGTPRKLMDNSKLEAQGWSSLIHLKNGIESTFEWFKDSSSKIRKVQV